MPVNPPDALLRARLRLEELPFYTLLSDWSWHPTGGRWTLRCRLEVQPGGLIPAESEWFILADEDYPWGEIEIHPSKDRGLVNTFPHQSHNAVGDSRVPWRDGKICAQTSLRFSGRRAYDVEPMSVEDRLTWRVTRAKDWLEAAARGDLARRGEPFELPDFPAGAVHGLGFIEDADSFRFWSGSDCQYGVATVVQPQDVDTCTVIADFKNERERIVRTIEYGSILSGRSLRKTIALWCRVPACPVLPPWQAPTTLGELRAVFNDQGADFDQILSGLAHLIRDGKRHMVLIGFPMPLVVGGENCVYHWQGLRLPVLSHGKLNGHRPLEVNFARNDAKTVLADKAPIDWVPSRNWADEQIRTRGHVDARLADESILVLGAGAVGAAVAELLVRQGCKHVVTMDGETLDIGNLCRHSLTVRHLYRNKAESVASRLNEISPHSRATGIATPTHRATTSDQQHMEQCDVIIDCTGDDRVLNRLQRLSGSRARLFASLSLGVRAKRAFLFCVHAEQFPHDLFAKAVAPWLERELEEYKGLELPRDGIGCWSAAFPARADDVWLMSAAAVKWIETAVMKAPQQPELTVFEQQWYGDRFAGLKAMTGL